MKLDHVIASLYNKINVVDRNMVDVSIYMDGQRVLEDHKFKPGVTYTVELEDKTMYHPYYCTNIRAERVNRIMALIQGKARSAEVDRVRSASLAGRRAIASRTGRPSPSLSRANR